MTLTEARRLVQLSQGELARRAGGEVSSDYISKVERGLIAEPSYRKVVLIVRALQRAGLSGIAAEQLFPVADHHPPDSQVA